MSKLLLLIFSLLVLSNCKSTIVNPVKKQNNSRISKEDSLYVEKELLSYKNVLFSDIYHLGIKNTLERNRIKTNKIEDDLQDLTYYYYGYYHGFNPEFMLEDLNRDKLLKKWIQNEDYSTVNLPPDHPKGSFDMARALDFYNSEDLKTYIDSLRQIEIKRITKTDTNTYKH